MTMENSAVTQLMLASAAKNTVLGVAVLAVCAGIEQVAQASAEKRATCDLPVAEWLLGAGAFHLICAASLGAYACLRPGQRNIIKAAALLASVAMSLGACCIWVMGAVFVFHDGRFSAQLDGGVAQPVFTADSRVAAGVGAATCPNFVYVPLAVVVLFGWLLAFNDFARIRHRVPSSPPMPLPLPLLAPTPQPLSQPRESLCCIVCE